MYENHIYQKYIFDDFYHFIEKNSDIIHGEIYSRTPTDDSMTFLSHFYTFVYLPHLIHIGSIKLMLSLGL